MELAMEASPESFGTVIMLYINCKVTIFSLCGIRFLNFSCIKSKIEIILVKICR